MATSSLKGAITSANHSLVKDGWCWWYRKYAPGDAVLEELEHAAREERKGLWADPQPGPPSGWSPAHREERDEWPG
jgi:endonuclease YncB( thermonuclease family)